MAAPSAPPPSYQQSQVYPPTSYASPYAQPYGGDYNNPSTAYGPNATQPNTTQNYGAQPPPPGYAAQPYPSQPNAYFGSQQTAGNPDGGIVNPNYGQNTSDSSFNGDMSTDHWAGSSFSSKAIRLAFIRKVYLILCSQLLVTLAFIAVFIFVKPVKGWVQENGWFYYISYAIFLVTYIVLVCCPTVRRKYPGNFICLAIFTLAFSYMVATISSFYDTKIVLIAVAITAGVCLGVTCFAIQTKWDFTMCGGLLFMLVLVLCLFGLSCIIVYATVGYNYIMQCVYGGLGALVFSLFLAYDTQMLIGGRKIELSPEEYIFGSLQLYLDVCYIFIFLLSMFGSKN